MTLTANFDYCVELGIAKVREIFHLAFKTEDRYPHNQGPFVRDLSGTEVVINVRIHDDNDRPSDLSFFDPKHILFSFPFDLSAEIADAPDPGLSRVTMQVRVNIPAKLETWREPPEDGNEVLGLSFFGVTPDDVEIVTLDGLPTISIDNFLAAIHNKYRSIQHVYTSGGNTLLLYDGMRDASLVPPNAATPSEIQAALEMHGANEYLKITAPIHLMISLPSPLTGTYMSYGRIICWRQVIRTDTTITVKMSTEPVDAALKTRAELDNVPSTEYELGLIRGGIHAKYDLIGHQYALAGNTLTIYDDTRDPGLKPVNLATPFNIEAAFETYDSKEYLKVTMPIHFSTPSVPLIGPYESYGRIVFWRVVTRTATQVSIDMATEPTAAALKNKVELDNGLGPVKAAVAAIILPYVSSALDAFGTVSAPSFEQAKSLLALQAVTAINSFGVITEPAFTEDAARNLLEKEIANYIKERRYPVYSPQPHPDAEEPLSTPVGFLLVDKEILAILLNRRTGTEADDHAPVDFLGSDEMALAVGRAKVDEFIAATIEEQFPDLDTEAGQLIQTEEGNATLHTLTVEPSDPNTHNQSNGHLWISGTAEVHIECWPDPDVSFSGPIFIEGEAIEEDGQCGLKLNTSVGAFDIGQSCCDVLVDLIIPIVGWIVLIVVESTIDAVGGEMAEDIAEGQGRLVDPLPPVVNGIAKVTACLIGISISSQGFVMPGTVDVRRYSRSFEDLETERNLPRPEGT